MMNQIYYCRNCKKKICLNGNDKIYADKLEKAIADFEQSIGVVGISMLDVIENIATCCDNPQIYFNSYLF